MCGWHGTKEKWSCIDESTKHAWESTKHAWESTKHALTRVPSMHGRVPAGTEASMAACETAQGAVLPAAPSGDAGSLPPPSSLSSCSHHRGTQTPIPHTPYPIQHTPPYNTRARTRGGRSAQLKGRLRSDDSAEPAAPSGDAA